MTDVQVFYGWWQMAVCLFAFFGLMSIWWHLGKKQGDFGQVWLALSILSWSFSGAIEVLFAHLGLEDNDIYLNGARSIFSLFNSLFILLSLSWFRYLPELMRPLIQSRYWVFVVGLPFVFSLLPTISRMISGKGQAFVNELDVYYAVLTLVFLGYVLWESFEKRRLKLLAWLSLLCILTTLIAQGYKLTGSAINLTLFSAIFKTTLIMLFFALALSWVKELADNVIPESSSLFLTFSRKKKDTGKLQHQVTVFGIKGKTSPVTLSQANFNLLLTFALKKASGSDWLDVKPKNDPRQNQHYDINDHNEIRRLNIAMVEGLFGKEHWTKDHHEIPLKNALFDWSEKRNRKVRLAIPSENLTIPAELTSSVPV